MREQDHDRVNGVLDNVLEQRKEFELRTGQLARTVLMSDDDHDLLAAHFAREQGLAVPVPADTLYGMKVGRFAGWQPGIVMVLGRLEVRD